MSSDHSAPPPPSADNSLMPRLYQAAIGPLHTAYYQQQFERFDALGKPSPSWNWAAGFCTLGWMGLRGLWRPAAVYAAVIAAIALLWWGLGLHQALPLPAALALLLFGVLLAIVIPGFGGNALYHRAVRQRTMQALSQSSTLTQAMQQLQAQAPSSTHLQWATSAQAATVLLAAGAAWAVGNVPAPGSNATSATIAAPNAPAAQTAPATAKSAGAPHTQADMARALAALQPAAPAALPPSTPASPAPVVPPVEPAAAAPAVAPATAAAAAIPIAPIAPVAPPPEAEKAQPATKPAKTDTQAAVEKLEKAAEKAKQRERDRAEKQAKAEKAEKAAKAEAASKAAAAPKSLQPGKYYLNSGIYARAENAQRVVRQLRAAGLPVFTQTLQSQKGEVTRVRVGPLDSRGQAESAAQKAQALHLEAQVFHYAAD